MTTKRTVKNNVANFEKFRNRAISKRGNQGRTLVTNEPFTLAEEDGFSPEVTIEAPTLETILVMAEAQREGDFLRMLRALFGPNESVRIIRTLSDALPANEAGDALSGVIEVALEHFYGEGAFEDIMGFSL